MSIKTSKIISSALLLAFSAFAEEASGPKVEFTGYLDADMAATYDKTAKNLVYQSNHEADLVANAKFSDKVTVSLGITSYTPKSVPAGGTPVVDASGSLTRWPTLYFDGVWTSYETDMGLKLLAGDFTVTEGAFSYYAYKRTLFAASIMKENYFRGLGVDYKGVSVYAGSSDLSNTASAGYLAYSFESGDYSAKPFFYITDDMDGNTFIKTGVSGSAKFGDHSVKASYGFLKDPDMDASQTAKVEAALAFGAVTVAGTAFYAILADDAAKQSVIDVPEESFYYVEPGYTVNDNIAVGLPLEIHNRAKGAKDSDFSTYPTLYVTPIAGSQVVVWGGPTFYYDTSADATFSFGTELIASF
jgi:hypothetical protein